ncbi:LysE/ArgO family amino acid transporter [Herbiconiux sp. L3-i23]|uniref:LysE/ArgO family amino acid transporter n=1 Tax=Herbiconiux sp. L3-i23 TaxID=2905871 RepID=UPI0020452F6F|nr:LysE/ArgO family amino acid transporter [Herbiconiux sp. L3-i23]BDI22015.1 transporter [Herbiconiux sp. L3-i23]
MSSPALAALAGFGTGLGLIVAIGAQNAYLLRMGVSGRLPTVALGVLLCAVSDAVLIVAGVAGMGALVQSAPVLLVVIRFAGAAFLIVYGLLAARRALVRTEAMGDADGRSLRRPLLTLLAFTWLNPHVYLDTVVLVGGVANQQPGDGRWWFAVGAVAASFVWFSSLGFGARLLRPLFRRPGTWRILDAIVAVILLALGVKLAIGA